MPADGCDVLNDEPPQLLCCIPIGDVTLKAVNSIPRIPWLTQETFDRSHANVLSSSEDKMGAELWMMSLLKSDPLHKWGEWRLRLSKRPEVDWQASLSAVNASVLWNPKLLARVAWPDSRVNPRPYVRTMSADCTQTSYLHADSVCRCDCISIRPIKLPRVSEGIRGTELTALSVTSPVAMQQCS